MITLVLTLLAVATAAPIELVHQGRLLDPAGGPLEGTHELVLHLRTEANASVWSYTGPVVAEAGYYQIVLGSSATSPLDSAAFASGPLFLDMTVDGVQDTNQPRLSDVPYAAVAYELNGGTVNASDVQVDGALRLGTVVVCDTAGVLRWDAPTDSVEVCDGSDWRALGADRGRGYYESAADAVAAGLTDHWLFDSVWTETVGVGTKVWTPTGANFVGGTSPYTALPSADRPSVANFDGSNDYARQPVATLSGSVFTQIFWVYMDAANSVQRSYIYDAQQSGRWYVIYDGSGTPSLNACNGQWYMPSSNNTGAWTMHVMRQDGTRMYYDRFGIGSHYSQSNNSGSCIQNDTNAYLATYYGAAGSSGQYFFNGKIAELSVYNGTSLSNSEIQAIYESRRPLLYAP